MKICDQPIQDIVVAKPYGSFTLLDRHFKEIQGDWLSDEVIDSYLRCLMEEFVS